jgi:hypothetical protein
MPEKFFIHYGFVKMVSPRCQRYKIFFSVAEGEAEWTFALWSSLRAYRRSEHPKG